MLAAAAARLLQSCLILCDLTDCSPPGSSVPGILQARILEWVTISFSNACMHAKSPQSCLTLCDPMDSSRPGSSIHRILQATILEWAAISLPISQKSGFIFKSQFIPRCSSCITVQKRVHKYRHTSVAVHFASSNREPCCWRQYLDALSPLFLLKITELISGSGI